MNERAARTIRNLYVENERVIMISRFHITRIVLTSIVSHLHIVFFFFSINSSPMTISRPFYVPMNYRSEEFFC